MSSFKLFYLKVALTLIFVWIPITYAPIPSDKCLYFNGDMSVYLPDSFDFANLSLVFWVNSQNNINNIQAFWSNRVPGCNMGTNMATNPSEGIGFFMNQWNTNNRQLVLECYNDTGIGNYGCSTYGTVENIVPSNMWIQLALVSELNGNSSIYMNGILYPNTGELMERAAKSPFNFSTLGEFLPAYVSGAQNYGFQGLMDEVTFWNTTLSVTEINTLMSKKPVDLTDPNLISYYNFNKNTLSDSKGNNHGSNNGIQPVQYTQVTLQDLCGDNIVEPQFGEQCDGGLGCKDCLCDASGGYVPYSPPRLDCLLASNGILTFGISITIIVVSVVTVIPLVCTFFFFLYHRNAPPITGATPVFCFLSIFGAVLLAISPIFFAQGIVFSCMAAIWLWGCGFILLFGSIVVKTWRIHRLFHANLTKFICITDKELVIYLAVLFIIEIIILVVWTVISPLVPPQTIQENLILGCQANHYYLPIMIIQLIYGVILLVVGCILALKVRNVPMANVREGTEILFSVYNFTILLVIIGAVVGSINSFNTQILLILVGLELAIIMSSVGLFWSKIYKIVLGKDLWKVKKSTHTASSTLEMKSGASVADVKPIE